jgi:hypothetical protein
MYSTTKRATHTSSFFSLKLVCAIESHLFDHQEGLRAVEIGKAGVVNKILLANSQRGIFKSMIFLPLFGVYIALPSPSHRSLEIQV